MGPFKDSKWSRHKIEAFWGAREFFGPIKWHERQQGPFLGPKKSRFCARDHLESLKWHQLVIFKGCFHTAQPHFQHSCIGIFMQHITLFFVLFFLVFGVLETLPYPNLNCTGYHICCWAVWIDRICTYMGDGLGGRGGGVPVCLTVWPSTHTTQR